MAPVAVTVMFFGSRWSSSLQVCVEDSPGRLAVASVGEAIVKVALLAVPQLPPGTQAETEKVQVVAVQSEMVRRWPCLGEVSVKAPHSPCQGDCCAWARAAVRRRSARVRAWRMGFSWAYYCLRLA